MQVLTRLNATQQNTIMHLKLHLPEHKHSNISQNINITSIYGF